MKLWAGRFQKETDALVNDFNSSISFDARMYREDITGSIAHAAMLGRQGIIKEHEAEKIIDGLKAILADIEAGQVEFSLENEDIHMNIETILTQRIGDTGKRLHTARSRNDQVAVDFRMYVRKEIQAIIGLILDLEKVLVRKAEANLDTVMPGYTHLQRAQPTTFAHAMMAYANMFKRDVTRPVSYTHLDVYKRQLLETAPPLKAESLADGYRVLAEFNGTVLAGKKTLLGAQFVTWAWDYDRRGVSNGHYCMEDYQTAKEDFTFRSGLMAREQVFDRERLEELRQAAQGFLCGEGPASYRQESRCQRILDQIRSQLPEPKQNQLQKEGPSIEQSM